MKTEVRKLEFLRRRSPPTGEQVRRAHPSRSASYTPTARVDIWSTTAQAHHFCGIGFSANRRLLGVQRLSHDPARGAEVFAAVNDPTITADGNRVAGLRFADARTHALLSALLVFRLLPHGFTNRELRAMVAELLGKNLGDVSAGQMTYDLRRLRMHHLITRLPGSHRYAGILDAPTTPGLRLDDWLTVFDLSGPAADRAGAAAGHVRARHVPDRGLVPAGPLSGRASADQRGGLPRHRATCRRCCCTGGCSRRRRNGLANVMMLHEADDLGGSADAHTALSKAVRALFAATSTFVVHALPEAKVHDLIAAGVPLSRTAVQTIPTLGRGIAWWQRGRRGGPRQTLLSDLETRLTDTDSAMTAGRAA